MYDTIASDELIQKTVEGLTSNNFLPIVVANKEEAMEKIKELIPAGASITNGTSKTLEQIGFIEYLKLGQHPWNNMHAAIVAEKDPAKQHALRKAAMAADYYLGSMHALSATGEFLIASNTGSQLPNIVFGSDNLILVVGAQKIMPTLEEANKRLNEYVVPLEDERLMGIYKAHTTLSKVLAYHKEGSHSTRKIHVMIVKEALGF